MSKNKNVEVDVVEEVNEAVVEPVAEPVKKAPKKAEKVPTAGVVVDCDSLNVRDGAAPDAMAICQINKGNEVEIIAAESTGEWFKIKTTAGVKGFCMKKYIEVK